MMTKYMVFSPRHNRYVGLRSESNNNTVWQIALYPRVNASSFSNTETAEEMLTFTRRLIDASATLVPVEC